MAVALPYIMMGAKVLGAIREGQAEKSRASYESRVNQDNAKIAKEKSDVALASQDRNRRLRLGNNRANIGSSGLDIGSFGDILSYSAQQEEADMLSLKSSGMLEENNYMNSSYLSKARGRNAVTNSYIKAGTSLLSGYVNLKDK